MRTAIKTSALFIVLGLLSTGVFATEKVKSVNPDNNKKDVVLFTSLEASQGVGVIIHKANASRSSVAIYDAAGNQIMKDVQGNNANDVLKGYVLSSLENGKYTIKVSSNKEEVKRVVNVYTDENNEKAFFFEM